MQTGPVRSSLLRRVATLAFLGAFCVAHLAAAAEPDPKTVRLWKAKCASCHGADGKAKTETGEKLGIPDMTTAAWQKKATDSEIKSTIENGIQRPGKPEGMDPYKDKLTPEQIDALAAYVRTLGK